MALTLSMFPGACGSHVERIQLDDDLCPAPTQWPSVSGSNDSLKWARILAAESAH